MGLTHRLQYPGLIFGARQKNQPMHSEVGEALGGIAIDLDPRGHTDLDILELAALVLARLANALDTFVGAFDIERESIPSFREASGAAVSLLGVSAEDNFRMRFLHRSRHRIDALERYPFSTELRLGHRPQRDHRLQIFFGARSLVIERRADRLELRFQIADADPENQPPIG